MDDPLISDTEFDFAPYMPDVTKRRPRRAFMIDPYLAMLVRNPPSNAEAEGFSEAIKYAHVFVTWKITDEAHALRRIFPIHFVALETGTTSSPVLHVFGRHCDHRDLGPDACLMDEEKFVERAIEIARKDLRIDEPAHELGAISNYPLAGEFTLAIDQTKLMGGLVRSRRRFRRFFPVDLCLADTPTANG